MTPIACGPARRSATALSTPPLIATATRSAMRRGAEDRPERVRERVHRERLAADRGRLEQRQPAEVARRARPRRRRRSGRRPGAAGRAPSTRRAWSLRRPRPSTQDGTTIRRRSAGPKKSALTLPMSPLRSEPGRTRWVPCGAARLPTHRPDTGSLAMAVGSTLARSHEQGRAPPDCTCQAAPSGEARRRAKGGHFTASTRPGRSSIGSVACPSPPSRAPRRAQASPRSPGRDRTGRGRQPMSARSSR